MARITNIDDLMFPVELHPVYTKAFHLTVNRYAGGGR